MGSITFQVVGDGTVGTKTKTYTVSDADVNRLVSWASTFYASPPIQGGTPTPLNTTQALLAWANDMFGRTKTAVMAKELNTARDSLVPTDFVGT